MKFSPQDWPHIKLGVIVFLLTLLLGGAIIIGSEDFLLQAHANQRTAQQQLNAARSQLADAREDRENMQTYMVEYSALLNRNITHSNQRLDWIEGLEKIRQQHHVSDFKYAIAPQQDFTPIPSLESGNFALKLSKMTLDFDLLHEGQLINFFNALHSQVKGRFILEQCTLERTGATAVNNVTVNPTLTTQLKAHCIGGWLALQNRNAS